MKVSFLFRMMLCALWLLFAAVGIAVISHYESTAGESGQTPQRWPAQTAIALDTGRPTLVMFAHPRCPCTRASLGELNRLLARCEGRVVVEVFFFKPNQLPAEWTRTDLWAAAAAIPGVRVHEDGDGAMARLFGAETSGFVVLYNPQGKLLFHGGITSSRGHAGECAGENTIASLLAGEVNDSASTPVYGCSLLSKSCSTNGILQ